MCKRNKIKKNKKSQLTIKFYPISPNLWYCIRVPVAALLFPVHGVRPHIDKDGQRTWKAFDQFFLCLQHLWRFSVRIGSTCHI